MKVAVRQQQKRRLPTTSPVFQVSAAFFALFLSSSCIRAKPGEGLSKSLLEQNRTLPTLTPSLDLSDAVVAWTSLYSGAPTSAAKVVTFDLGDGDLDQDLILLASSANQELIPDNKIEITRDNQRTGYITLEPSPGRYGITTIQVIIANQFKSTMTSFEVHVPPVGQKSTPETESLQSSLAEPGLIGMSGPLTYALDSSQTLNGVVTLTNVNSGEFVYQANTPGPDSFQYRITAVNSGKTLQGRMDVVVQAVAPSNLSYSSSSLVYERGSAIAAHSPSSTGGRVASYSIDPSLPAGLSFNPSTGVISGTPSAIQNPAVVHTITATNSGGSTSTTLTVTVNDMLPTVAYSEASYTLTQGASYSISASSQNASSFSIGGTLPAGLSFNTASGEITGTPSGLLVATPYLVTVMNSSGQTSSTIVRVSVIDVSPSQLTYSVPSAVYTLSNAIADNAPAISGGAVTNYSIDPALPTGLTLNTSTGVISGTPSSTQNPAVVHTITAMNSGGSTSTTLTVTVNEPLPMVGYPQASYTLTKDSSYTISASSQHASTFSLSGDLPAGLFFNSTTGVIIGVPSETFSATSLQVTAMNSTGQSATTMLQLAVLSLDQICANERKYWNNGNCYSSINEYSCVNAGGYYDRRNYGDFFESPITQVSASLNHTCALNSLGQISCWGSNQFGQLNSPSGTGYTQLSSHANHTCALNSAGYISCWGDFSIDQTDANSGTGYVQISTGESHICALNAAGQISCWAGSSVGQADAPSGAEYTQISVADYHSCALNGSGQISCWGANWAGQTNSPSGSFSQISAGSVHACALDPTGQISCWGYNSSGQNNAPSGTGYTQISSGYSNSCALDGSGQISCWGPNWNGQTNAPSGAYSQVSVGGTHVCALNANGEIFCWGDNSSDQRDPRGHCYTGGYSEYSCIRGGNSWFNGSCYTDPNQYNCVSGGNFWSATAGSCYWNQEEASCADSSGYWDGYSCYTSYDHYSCTNYGGYWADNNCYWGGQDEYSCVSQGNFWSWNAWSCYSSQAELSCADNGGYWGNNACYSGGYDHFACKVADNFWSWNDWSCYAVSDQSSCEGYGGYWGNNTCYSDKNEYSCGKEGLYWKDGVGCFLSAQAETCASSRGLWANNTCYSGGGISIADFSLKAADYCSGDRLSNTPFAGGTGTQADPYTICTASQLQAIATAPASFFLLAADIDLANFTWQPILVFSGLLDGGWHSISNLTLDLSTFEDVHGLFRNITGGAIRRTALLNASVQQHGAGWVVGSLAGHLTFGGLIERCRSTGYVSGDNGYIGGLVGLVQNGALVTNSYSSATVNGGNRAGGLVGGMESPATVSYSYATGAVSHTQYSGSFIGPVAWGSTLRSSYATDAGNGLPVAGYTSGGYVYSSSTVSDTQMRTPATFSGWDPSIWQFTPGQYPTLRMP